MLMAFDTLDYREKYYGKFPGVVTSNEDSEIQGRIIVELLDFGGLLVPAYPCIPYGNFFIPPVGTNVWIEFLRGDINNAIWVGVYYPKGTTPIEAAINPPENRVIQTASGHTIELLDKKGEETIRIKHKDNAIISIDKQGTILLKKGDNTTLEMQGNKVIIQAQTIELQSSSIKLGAGAQEKTILGQTFAKDYANHTHASPSSPPSPPVPLIPSWLTSAVEVK